ncbi:MAG: type II toxin-antitoxin system RelE/ParE family toxin [Rubrobacteraceae bacterium]
MRVNWTETAIEHLSGIQAYVAQNSPAYARRIVDRLTRRSRQIAQFPYSGRAVPELDLPQVREVLEGPYRIIYRIRPDQIDVLAVIHSAQQTPWNQ